MHREGAVSSHPFTLVGVCCWSKSSSATLCTGCEEYSSTEIQPLNDALRGRPISTEQELQDIAHQCSVAQTKIFLSQEIIKLVDREITSPCIFHNFFC
ncbi:hypothetical protein AVEN_160325-1 [Araneus ventricosus]|uniref:Uncharacterized protein n=1 Tax=Araneus ventricosus TaxID=182803 RepID=A0A4Y2J2A2_ARAVE|nr:hypothetical protein AVEN_238051-1 [Araneus ventricosus]GBM84093.1 hypothetical protein AVEN_160325-1 [Araneus ventricosus]